MPASHMTHFRVQQRGYKFQDWHPKNSLRGKIHNISDSTINQSKPKSECDEGFKYEQGSKV